METPIEYELGVYGSRRYFLWAHAEPDYDRPDDFVANVHYETASTYANVEIARIDTAHGFTHFHQLYREHQPTVPFDGGLWDAMEHLGENWPEYARLYSEYHGQ